MSIYFNIIGIRKYVIKKIIYNVCNTIHGLVISNDYKYRLFNVLRWLWNIYEGAELPSVYYITNTKHCITYLALTQLFPVLV